MLGPIIYPWLLNLIILFLLAKLIMIVCWQLQTRRKIPGIFYNVFIHLDNKVLSQSLFNIYLIDTVCDHVSVWDNGSAFLFSNNANTNVICDYDVIFCDCGKNSLTIMKKHGLF